MQCKTVIIQINELHQKLIFRTNVSKLPLYQAYGQRLYVTILHTFESSKGKQLHNEALQIQHFKDVGHSWHQCFR